jgi:RecB family endonuclease NucS
MTMVFTPMPLENREDLARLVAEHCEILEEGLKIVERGEGGTNWGPMDLLAMDARGRLAVIEVAPRQGDQLLVEGLAHMGWFHRNRQRIAGPLTEQGVDLALYPRLILVAEDFSTIFREAMEGLRNMAVDLLRYRWLEASGQKGFLLESVFSSSSGEEMKTVSQALISSLTEGIVPLAEEEIATFIEMDPRFTL